ncbi:Hypothetical protein AA314_07214 [Archangium gephyra]|uniref:Uncharacterized protein n=1 Tax=Archangium gephyra TaxID=48 RepID=A0AAC8QE48_9BACT|nr:Hypothetical protein AA314_07214 [Archangium gephyra]
MHAFVLGAIAVVVAAITATPSDPGSFLPLDGLFDTVLWIMFAAYSAISSLGIIVTNSWTAFVGVHVVAGVLAYPASIPVLMLLGG